jgi:V/A-type H+-transporting ATPase subunit D
MATENLAPTRMNLLSRRAQIKLARDGVQLLKGKREALLKELIARARELKVLRSELNRRGRMSVTAMAMARAVNGSAEIRAAGLAGQRSTAVRVHEENVWGLRLARVEHDGLVREPHQRGIGRLDVCSHVIEASDAAERMLEQLVLCAAVERNLKLLGEEVRKVTRRINALEEALLPRLHDDVGRIMRVLDEREREDVFRLKRIKKRKESGALVCSGGRGSE